MSEELLELKHTILETSVELHYYGIYKGIPELCGGANQVYISSKFEESVPDRFLESNVKLFDRFPLEVKPKEEFPIGNDICVFNREFEYYFCKKVFLTGKSKIFNTHYYEDDDMKVTLFDY